MKLIKPSTEIWEQEPGIEGMFRHIERCARVCYKSEDKTGEDTAEKMVDMLIEKGHTAMLEHGTVYLQIPVVKAEGNFGYNWAVERYSHNPYSRITTDLTTLYVTTNYRVLVENNWDNDMMWQCEPTEYHKRRITVHFTCDRGISHELVRHRVFSFAQESTRYCNYSKAKFENEVTFIEPHWKLEECFLNSLEDSENTYMELLRKGWTPQQARSVLPNSLKTEVCMTGFLDDWEGFFKLRCAQIAHPQIRELAVPLQEKLKSS